MNNIRFVTEGSFSGIPPMRDPLQSEEPEKQDVLILTPRRILHGAPQNPPPPSAGPEVAQKTNALENGELQDSPEANEIFAGTHVAPAFEGHRTRYHIVLRYDTKLD